MFNPNKSFKTMFFRELNIKTKKNGDIYIEQKIKYINPYTVIEIIDTKGDVELNTFSPKKVTNN